MTSPDKVSPLFSQTKQGLFVLAVESFSVLSNSKINKFKSQEFDADGFKWRLELYPKGDTKRNGQDHISLYLSVSDITSLPRGWEIEAKFSLFVYNYNSREYLTCQVSNVGSISRSWFHNLNKKCGYPQFIALSDFMNTSNGYLFGDTCIFRAQVSVVTSALAEMQCVSVMKGTVKDIYRWTITNFSAKENDEIIYSDKFVMGELKWRLVLYPKGNGVGEGKFISLFIQVADDQLAKLPENWEACFEFKLRLINQGGYSNNHAYHGLFNIDKKGVGYGQHCFVALTKFKDFVCKDCVVVEAELTVAAVTKDFK